MSNILSQFLNPLPILLVGGGAGVIACAQQGASACGEALRALGPLVCAHPENGRDAARAALHRIDAVAELRGLARTDRVRAGHPFIAAALTTLANAPDIDRFSLWADQALADREERHARIIGWWNAVADTAPAMGMAGTIIGLIGMFAGMSNPATIGPAMALALMTTLYGMVLANAVAGPVANRLARLSTQEIAWQRALIERMTAIARRETPAPPARRATVREAA